MKHYIWLNPVVLAMYGEEPLERVLAACGYELVACRQNHMAHVKQQYEAAVKESEACVLDVRCPAAAAYVKLKYPDAAEHAVFPEIEPILLHAARELAENLDFSDGSDLTVITPCRELKELGERQGMAATHFLTWKELVAWQGIRLNRTDLEKSPIPPGFFAEYGEQAACLTSRQAIDEFFGGKGYKAKRIAEMLICRDGCHNGNGM